MVPTIRNKFLTGPIGQNRTSYNKIKLFPAFFRHTVRSGLTVQAVCYASIRLASSADGANHPIIISQRLYEKWKLKKY